MPQHKGFEPFMRIWVLQVRIRYKGTGSSNYDCADSRCIFFVDAQSYSDYLAFIATGQRTSDPRHIELVTDFGERKWWNDKLWFATQMNNLFTNGYFDPTLQP
jgi:hypothetical protein